MKKILSFVIVLFISQTTVFAGESDQFIIGDKVTLKSNILNEDRSILVYLPQSYHTSKTDYPVIYILDGMAHFHHVSGIVQYLSSRGLMPETIVIAIINVDRTRDFSPTKNPNFKNSGGSEKFMMFLDDELIPFVNRNYRTLDYKTLVGHSFGGTFTTYAFLNRPDVFQSYIAISPYLHYENDILVKEASSKLKVKYDREQNFYMTLGYEPRYFSAVDEFAGIMNESSPKRLNFKYVQMLDETHMSIPHRSIYNGLEFFYADWEVDQEVIREGLAALDKHYKKLSKKYGYTIETPEAKINELGYHYMNLKELGNAILIFEENVNRFPESPNVYDSLGEAYEKNDQPTQAGKNYKKAVQIGKENQHPYLNTYIQNLERVEKSK